MKKETRKLYEMKAEVIQAIAHPIRLAIVDYLAGGDGRVSFRAFLGTHAVKANGRRTEFDVDKPGAIEAAVRLA